MGSYATLNTGSLSNYYTNTTCDSKYFLISNFIPSINSFGLY